MSNVEQNKKKVRVYFNDLRDYETKKLDQSLLDLISVQLGISENEYIVISRDDVHFNFNSNEVINLDEHNED